MKEYERLSIDSSEEFMKESQTEFDHSSYLYGFEKGFLKAREMAIFEVRDSEFENVIKTLGEKEV